MPLIGIFQLYFKSRVIIQRIIVREINRDPVIDKDIQTILKITIP